MDDIGGKQAKKYFQEAYRKNLLSERTTIRDTKHYLPFLREFNRVGTNWLKNSDDWNRIVTMRTVQRAVDQEWGRLSAGKTTFRKFMRDTNAVLLDEGQLKEFMGHFESGNVDNMKGILERHMVYQTQFDYTKAQKPAEFQTALGRVAGSYSTYPLQFGEMLSTALKRKGPMYGLKLASNMWATSYLYNDMLGIEGVEGNVLNVAAYTGGPMMTSGLDFMQTANRGWDRIVKAKDIATGISAAGQTGKELGRLATRIAVPMSWYPRRFSEGLESLGNGEYMASMMSFMGLNVNEDALALQLEFDDIESIFSDDQ